MIRSAILFATVYDAAGDTVPNPVVAWDNLNPQVAGMNTSGAVAAVAGLAEGVASIVARSGDLADTAEVTVVADTSLVVGEGTVAYIELEGGFYAIRADDGVIYDPINLPAALAIDGLRVGFAARIRRDLGGIHMTGPLVELLRIERR